MLTNRSDLPKVLESKTLVRFQDCDPFGHLNNARYIDYFMNARTDHLRDNYDFEIFAWGKQTGESWVVTKTKIAYLWPAGISEEVMIRTRLIHFDTSLLRVEAIMLDAAGRRVKAVGWVEFAYISMASGRPVRHGDELTSFFSSVVADDVEPNLSFDDRVNEVKSEFRKKPAEEMQPTPLTRGRKLPVWVKVAAGIVVVMVAIPILGIVFQMIATETDRRTYPPPGTLVDVGGWQMHLVCEGDAQPGKPTVIFESALGANSLAWSKAMPLVANHTRACAYDRAGYGWSDPSQNPRDGQQLARELHALLDAAGETPPYILVGHSLGGLLVRVYRDVYPEDVAALVLVDARHPDFFTRMPPDYLAVDEQNHQRSLMMEQITPFGLSRLAGAFGLLDAGTTNIIQPLPQSMQGAARAVMIHNPRHWQTANAERALNELTYGQARQAAPLGDLPLIVLSAENGLDRWTPASGIISQQARTAWDAMQADLVALSTNSRHIIVKGGGHYFHLEQPEAIEDAILSLLDVP